MTTATAIYKSIMFQCERRRLALGWPMWKVDDVAGTQDGYYSKALYPETPSGRQAQWASLQLIISALFGAEVSVVIDGLSADMPSAPGIDKGASTKSLEVRHWRHSRHFKQLGRMGGKARMSRMNPTQLRRHQKRAAKARWSKPKLVEITPKKPASAPPPAGS